MFDLNWCVVVIRWMIFFCWVICLMNIVMGWFGLILSLVSIDLVCVGLVGYYVLVLILFWMMCIRFGFRLG